MDPQVALNSYSSAVLQNLYETLLWYNGSSSSSVIPWLAQNYTVSADLRTYNFTLRSGIHFADGEPFNSTAVYFSLNRLLILDGSTPTGHGLAGSFILQQFLNHNLSTVECGCSIKYNSQYVQNVLAQHFVQITGPMTFTLHVSLPSTEVPYALAVTGASILAPKYVMQRDIAMWNGSNTGYSLPFPIPSGNFSNQIQQYFMDEVSTCNTGATPTGCGGTYLNTSPSGSLAGTGPYTLQSYSTSTQDIVLNSTHNYWGGPYSAPIVPHFLKININYVPQITTREIDLQNGAKAGSAMSVDIPPDRLYDVADRNSWLNNNQLVATYPNVNLLGPYTGIDIWLAPFPVNITNPQTGHFYSFQPFADKRFRLAFADAVNMTEINTDFLNRLGTVPTQAFAPSLPPAGIFNSSIRVNYGYDPVQTQNLLLDAMLHPLTSFTFYNGTAAPSSVFNNTFGCSTLNSQNQCSNPVPQTISLDYIAGRTVDEAIMNQIATVVNNISTTYNMGLTVSVVPYPISEYNTLYGESALSMYIWSNVPPYPSILYELETSFVAGFGYPLETHWNLTVMNPLFHQALTAEATGNISGLARVSSQMNELGNQAIMYLWTYYPQVFAVLTSNVHGYYYNPVETAYVQGFYFATMY